MLTIAQAERPAIDRSPKPGPVRVGGSIPRPAESSQRVEGRKAPRRLQASDVPSITGVRLRPIGADATLLNISASGVLVECTSRLRLGTAVTVVFEGTFSPSAVGGWIARSSVATVSKNGVLRYAVGIAFQNLIALDPAPETVVPASEAAPEPLALVPSLPPPSVNRW